MQIIRCNKNNVLTFLSLTILSYLMTIPGSIKYGFMILPLFILFIVNTKNNILYSGISKIFSLFMIPIIYYIVSTMIIMIIRQEFYFYASFFRQVIFISLPLLVSYVINIFSKLKKINMPRVLFWSITIVFLITNISTLKNGLTKDLFEGVEAFIYGLFLIYFMYKKHYRIIPITLLLMYLGHKRIAIASIMIVFVIYCVISLVKKNKRNFIYQYIFFLILLISIVYIYFIYSGELSNIFNKFDIDDMGRIAVYNFFKQHYTFNIDFIGRGLGYTEYMLKDMHIEWLKNIHCDILRVYIELGMIGFFIYFSIFNYVYFYIKKYDYRLSQFYILCFIYTFVNLFTDNLLVYAYYLIPFYSLIIYEFDKVYKNT